jgi:hypothetical protein
MRANTRWLAATVLAVLMGGCQQPDIVAGGTADVGAITPEYVAGLPVRDGEKELDRLGDAVDARIDKSCATATDRQGCLRTNALAAFGNDPAVQRHCPPVSWEECVLINSEIVRMMRAVGADPETEVNWSDWRASFDRAEDLMAAEVEARCSRDQASDIKACMTMRAIELFGGSPEAGRRCAEQDADDRYLCVTNVRAAYLHVEALARLPQ